MKPVVNELQEKYDKDIQFIAYNIDDPNSLAAMQTYNFYFQPHFLFVDENGEIIEQWLGYTSASAFEHTFDNYLE